MLADSNSAGNVLPERSASGKPMRNCERLGFQSYIHFREAQRRSAYEDDIFDSKSGASAIMRQSFTCVWVQSLRPVRRSQLRDKEYERNVR